MSKRNRKIAKFMIPSTLSLCVDWVDPAWRHSEPASWSSRSAPMSTAPHMFVPRSSQAGSCRVNFVWIFLWKFGRLVHKRWQETWRQERNSSYEKLYFLPFLSFFYDQLKKLALVLKDGCSNDVVQVRLTFGHEPGKGNIGNDGSGEQWPSWFRWFWGFDRKVSYQKGVLVTLQLWGSRTNFPRKVYRKDVPAEPCDEDSCINQVLCFGMITQARTPL